MRAVLLTIGDELLSGDTVDTNSAFLARELTELGVRVVARHSVPDDVEAIGRALRLALTEAPLVITTGGLGPTRDDMTLMAASRALGVELETDPEQYDRVRQIFTAHGLKMPELDPARMLRVVGGRQIVNPAGTAPAEIIEVDAGTVILLPGVPREVVELWRGGVRRTLLELLGAVGGLRRWTLRTVGVGESTLAARLEADGLPDRLEAAGITLAYLPGHGRVDLRLTVRDGCDDAGFTTLATELVHSVGSCAYGADGSTLSEVVGGRLVELGLRLGVAESCTGGKLGKWLTDPPGSSRYFVGGVTAYANPVKETLLGVPPSLLQREGAVSGACAAAMARGALRALDCDVALSTTGIAGPDGGTPDKPVGTVYLGLALGPRVRERMGWDQDSPPADLTELEGLNTIEMTATGACFTRRLRMLGDRDLVRLRSVLYGLDTLRRALGTPRDTLLPLSTRG